MAHYFINFRCERGADIETIDWFGTNRKEALRSLEEYKMGADPDARYWLSTRPTSSWRKKNPGYRLNIDKNGNPL